MLICLESESHTATGSTGVAQGGDAPPGLGVRGGGVAPGPHGTLCFLFVGLSQSVLGLRPIIVTRVS